MGLHVKYFRIQLYMLEGIIIPDVGVYMVTLVSQDKFKETIRNTRITAFRFLTQCYLGKVLCLGETYCLHLQVWRVKEARNH
jgi:hypothetical protein